MIKKLLNTKISKENKKGFTLAELLIVVAIIGVLVAVSIPIFTSQLEKSKEATDIANVRSAYAEVMAKYLTDDSNGASMSVTAKQGITGWQGTSGVVMTQIDGVEGSIAIPDTHINGDSYVVTIKNDDSGSAIVTIQ